MDSSSSSSFSRGLNKCLTKYSTSKDFVLATPLVEVFSLYVNEPVANEEKACGGLYGTIEAVDINGSIDLYRRTRLRSEMAYENHSVCFTGPHRSISSSIGFAVNVELQMRNNLYGGGDVDGFYHRDYIVSRWQLSWDVGKPQVAYIARGKFLTEFSNRVNELSTENLYRVENVKYDQVLKAVFREKDGYATMYYAIFQYAVQAWVWVYVVYPWNDKNYTSEAYDIHGKISAKYGNFTYDTSIDPNIEERCKAIFLNTRISGSVKGVCHKTIELPVRIRLSRSLMVVPAYSSLVIEVDMWYKDIESSRKTLKGTVEFPSSGEGYSIDYMTGDGDIGLKFVVGWSSRSVRRDPEKPYRSSYFF